VVNASSSGRIVVELDAKAAAEFFDVCGKPAGRKEFAPGVHVIDIPVSGECIFTRL
jgi:hypothetical protein